jgi:epidermal growth factor receptor substrate 15
VEVSASSPLDATNDSLFESFTPAAKPPMTELAAPVQSPKAEPEPEAGQEPQVTTPRQPPAALALAPENPTSPTSPTTTDFFHTPPSTAVPEVSMSPAEHAAHAATRPSVPGGFPGDDLMSQVHEKDVDDSDSSDEDDMPLSAIAGKGKQPAAFDDAFGEKATTPKATETPATAGLFGGSVFDEAFKPAQPVAEPAVSSGIGSFSNSAFDDAFKPTEPPKAETNGVNAFDEAMGKLPESAKPDNTSFSFDTTFDDNFDFGSAAPVPAQQPATNALSSQTNGFDNALAPAPAAALVQAPPLTHTFSFDDAFGASQPTAQPAHAAPAANGNGSADNSFSFDDAFGAVPSSPAAKSGSQASAPVMPTSPLRASSTMSGSTTSFPRAGSPPSRGASPPPRHQSPRPRPSTGSMHSSHEKEAPKPEKTRNSRLSVRVTPITRTHAHMLTASPPADPAALREEEEGRGGAAAAGRVRIVAPVTAARGA